MKIFDIWEDSKIKMTPEWDLNTNRNGWGVATGEEYYSLLYSVVYLAYVS